MSEVMERDIGSEFRIVNQLIHRKMEFFRMEDQCSLTWVQTHIICFLIKHQEDEKGIFQKDVEKELKIRRSTASQILNVLVRDGYLIRQPVAQDARLKKLVLTEKALKLDSMMKNNMTRMEALLKQGLTQEDLSHFFYVLDRIKKNLE